MKFMSNKTKKLMNHYKNEVINLNIQGIQFIVKYRTFKLPKSIELQIPKLISQIKYAIKNSNNRVSPEHIKIIYYPINQKKQVPNSNETFKVDHVNSGVTSIWRNSQKREIIIFRREEAVKVLLHELLHVFEYHCVKHFTLNSNELICLGKTLELKQNWDEAIVETWAAVLTNENIYKKRNMNTEKIFSIFQTAKILRHYGFNNWNEFWIPNSTPNQIIPSNPSLFPYYILKSAFINNLELFKETFNFNSISKCNSRTSSDIIPFLENKNWIAKVDKAIEEYDISNQLWKKTMRMTYPNYTFLTKKSKVEKKKKKKKWKKKKKKKW